MSESIYLVPGSLIVSSLLKIPSDIPLLKKPPAAASSPDIPSHLQLSSEARAHLQAHLDVVGIDRHRFKHTAEDQSELFCRFAHLLIS